MSRKRISQISACVVVAFGLGMLLPKLVFPEDVAVEWLERWVRNFSRGATVTDRYVFKVPGKETFKAADRGASAGGFLWRQWAEPLNKIAEGASAVSGNSSQINPDFSLSSWDRGFKKDASSTARNNVVKNLPAGARLVIRMSEKIESSVKQFTGEIKKTKGRFDEFLSGGGGASLDVGLGSSSREVSDSLFSQTYSGRVIDRLAAEQGIARSQYAYKDPSRDPFREERQEVYASRGKKNDRWLDLDKVNENSQGGFKEITCDSFTCDDGKAPPKDPRFVELDDPDFPSSGAASQGAESNHDRGSQQASQGQSGKTIYYDPEVWRPDDFDKPKAKPCEDLRGNRILCRKEPDDEDPELKRLAEQAEKEMDLLASQPDEPADLGAYGTGHSSTKGDMLAMLRGARSAMGTYRQGRDLTDSLKSSGGGSCPNVVPYPPEAVAILQRKGQSVPPMPTVDAMVAQGGGPQVVASQLRQQISAHQQTLSSLKPGSEAYTLTEATMRHNQAILNAVECRSRSTGRSGSERDNASRSQPVPNGVVGTGENFGFKGEAFKSKIYPDTAPSRR